MSLSAYRKKRHLERTPEPRGGRTKRGEWEFTVQRHAASHLHYDFRLALDGVLKSWAVPKGPSLDPRQKRLAVEVEDHPLEYADFEGTIPKGEYGGGTVMLWDRGHWQPDGDPHRGFREGKLEFHLDGSKLHGGWVLIRSARKASGGKNTWLLIKRRDADAQTAAEGDILEQVPSSVAAGRGLDDIAAGRQSPIKEGKSQSESRGKGYCPGGSFAGRRPHEALQNDRSLHEDKTVADRNSRGMPCQAAGCLSTAVGRRRPTTAGRRSVVV
jgi:bifunctional non-homologous end joining protein LigD